MWERTEDRSQAKWWDREEEGSGLSLCNQGQLEENTISLGEGRNSKSTREED